MRLLKLILTTLLTCTSFTTSERILALFYHPGPSHFFSFYPLFDALAERGHHVTALTYTSVKNHHKNYNELILEGIPVVNNSITYDEMLNVDRSMYTIFAEFFELYGLAEMERNLVLNSPHIDRILHMHAEQPFDLVLTELFISDCFLGLIHKLNVPYIGFSTCGLPPYYYDHVSLPDFPSYVPFAFGSFSWRMNWHDRIFNWFSVKSWKLLYRLIQIEDNKLIRKRFGNDIPDVAVLAKNISLILVNQHYSFTGPKPLSNQVVEVSGIHLKPAKPLPQNLKNVLDNAKSGAILVSWGSNIKSSSIPFDLQQEILKGFAKLPHQIIWKWENESINDIAPSNVFASPWLPQQDILCHPNLKVFWGHGGNNGAIEAVHCGKPIIFTPFYGDQFMNAASLEARGMGFSIQLSEINADKIYDVVQMAMKPEVYQIAQSVSYEHRNRLASPIDTAVFWIEHTIATGGFALGKLHTNDMYWFTYYSIDAILAISLPISLIVWIIARILKWCIRSKKGQRTTDEKKLK